MLDLDKMCREALQRINYFINRSAGQQKRQMAAAWQKRHDDNTKAQHEKTNQN